MGPRRSQPSHSEHHLFELRRVIFRNDKLVTSSIYYYVRLYRPSVLCLQHSFQHLIRSHKPFQHRPLRTQPPLLSNPIPNLPILPTHHPQPSTAPSPPGTPAIYFACPRGASDSVVLDGLSSEAGRAIECKAHFSGMQREKVKLL